MPKEIVDGLNPDDPGAVEDLVNFLRDSCGLSCSEEVAKELLERLEDTSMKADDNSDDSSDSTK